MEKQNRISSSPAVKLGVKRIGATKTRKIDDYFKIYILFAKKVEESATSSKQTDLAKIARQYKITMKKLCDECQRKIKNYDTAKAGDEKNSCRKKLRDLAYELANMLCEKANAVVKTYDIAYNFLNKLENKGTALSYPHEFELPKGDGQYIPDEKSEKEILDWLIKLQT